MTEANIYALNATQWGKSLPRLLEQLVIKGNRIHVFCDDEKVMHDLDTMIWTFEQLSFIPHATFKDKWPEKNPIVLSTSGQNLNQANVLVITGKKLPEELTNFVKVVLMYHELDIIMRDQVMGQVEYIESKGVKCNFFRQSNSSIWERAVLSEKKLSVGGV